MSSYKLVIPPMTIHFCEEYPGRKKPVMAVSFDGENCQYKVASFKDAKRFDGEHWVRMEDKVTHWMPLPQPPKEET